MTDDRLGEALRAEAAELAPRLAAALAEAMASAETRLALPPGAAAALASLDELNRRLGLAVIEDGRFLVGTSKLGERTILRPAGSNWRTRAADVDEFAAVVRELGRQLHAAG